MNRRMTLFFFSGTGNTWWVSQRLAEALEARGLRCRAVSIESVDAGEVRRLAGEADILGIGYPIYGSDLPQPMKDFIDEVLPTTEPWKPSLVFCTQLIFSGDGATVYRRELKAKGYRIRWADHLRMPNNVCVTAMPLKYTNDPERLGRHLARAQARVNRLAVKISEDRPAPKASTFLSWLLGIQQRGWYRLFFNRMRDDIGIDPEKCTLCGRCTRICPAGNLYLAGDSKDANEGDAAHDRQRFAKKKNGRIETRGICILCLRCYNFCPVQAVIYMGKQHKPRRGLPYRGPVKEFRPELLI